MNPKLSTKFRLRIKNSFGQDGESWLDELPQLLEEFGQRWSLQFGDPFQPLSYHYVAPARREDGIEAIFKAGVPREELRTEAAALQAYGGDGAARLLESDPEQGVLLLERLKPGQPLRALQDDARATMVAAEVMQILWKAEIKEHLFPVIGDWVDGFQRLKAHFGHGTGPFPEEMVVKAEQLCREMIDDDLEPVLLHGDLHHWNLLSAERAPWLAIDPKGVIGEPAYEVGAWLRNPVPDIARANNRAELTNRRVAQFSDLLGYEKERLRAWGFSQALLASWWSYEEGGEEWPAFLEMARVLDDVV
jgi:streptomycin 6-kinase